MLKYKLLKKMLNYKLLKGHFFITKVWSREMLKYKLLKNMLNYKLLKEYFCHDQNLVRIILHCYSLKTYKVKLI